MDGEKLLLLENAAKDVMSPPYAVTEEKRREAEAIFMDLKKTQRPYDACKFILENSSSDYVLFQAGSTVRDAVIREWELLSGEERVGLRGYLLHYITSRPDLVSYVREQLVQTVALMVKRATLEEDRRALFDSVFTTVTQLLMTENSKMLSCSLLSAVLTEFSNSSGSSNIGMPIEFHVKCKILIQDEELLRILVFTVQFLRQYVSVDLASLPPSHLSLLSNFLHLLSKILTWEFRISKFCPLNVSDVATVTLRPPRSYAATFLDPSFLELLFSLLGKMWCNEDLLHHLTQGLTQLASLAKPVLASVEEQQRYLSSFVSGLLGYISVRPELTRQEVYGLSCILRRLATNFSPSLFSSLPPPQLSLLVSSLTQLTCLTAHKSATEEEGSEESLMYVESLDHCLEVFVSLLTEPRPLPPSLLAQPCVQVFTSYLKSKLVAPRGWQSPHREEGEIFELEEDDREAFSDQLRSIGCIARSIPHRSFPLLVQTIHQCTESCMEKLEVIRRDSLTLYSKQNDLDSTYEDLHWLVLISSFTLCDITRGEKIQIPANLMRYSIQRHKELGSESVATEDVSQLVWREGGGGQVDLSSSNLDPIISLFLSLCRLCMVEKTFISGGLIDVLSPQLSSTLVWCLSHVTHPYVHLTEDSYDQISLPLLSVFGRDAPSSQWLCVFLLDKVTFNLSVWSMEESVAVDTVALLGTLVKNTDRASVVVKCEMIWSLMRGFASGGPEVAALPPRAQRDLICSLVRCAVRESRQPFLSQLLGPLRQRFSSLVGNPNLRRGESHSPATVRELLSLLEALCGLALNSRPALIQELFDYLLPLLQASVQLLELYADTPEVVGVILELFALSAENYVVFLSQEHTVELYKVCLDLIHSYARSNTGKYRRTGLGPDEEESCEDLLQFLKMMTHLTVKDYINSGSPHDGEPVDVVIAGLNTILPLMTTEILKFPSLCRQFYILVNYVCESCRERFPNIPHQLFLTFMDLLETGLHNYGPEVRILCLEGIEGVASCHARAGPPHSSQTLTDVLQHFLKVIFDQMLSASFDMDTIHSTSGAVYAIICYHKESYLSLANSLISSQSDPQNQSRLMEAFSLLTPHSLPLDSKRASSITFRKNLEQFLPFVKGFLCYK